MIGALKACSVLAICCLLFPLDGIAQKTKNQLKTERQENVRKIKETERILRETRQQREASLGELQAINRRVDQQGTLIQSIQSEIDLLDIDIVENAQIVDGLNQDLQLLKEEYATMLFSAQKASGKINQLALLFSSKSFTQLFMRLKYMEQYSKARLNQAKAIIHIRRLLSQQIDEARSIRQQKNELLGNRMLEAERLASLRQQQADLIKRLEKNESKLKQDIKITEKAVARLDQLISAIVREEADKAVRKNQSSGDSGSALSSLFEKNKYKFSWPAPGFISQSFGLQPHPVLKGIEINNDGINIQTRQDQIVRTIFKGEVRAVAFIPSIGTSVIISHGNYYTVYSGLKGVLVKQQQIVETNQEIGQVQANVEGISELRFQIRKNTLPVNPEEWLKR